ncbi:MAG: hypothetical protein OXQ90_14075 [Gammaproteobacteria bacterium]|nr:hypothetical protein [Gammaproteobacteria bacterium]
MRRFALVAVFALGSVAGYAGEAPEERTGQTEPPADEQPSDRERVRKDEPAKRSQVSLEDATAIVRQAYGGRVVSAVSATARPARSRKKEPSAGEREGLAPRKKEPSAGEREGLAPRKQDGYRVRVDVDGRVKTVFVDARGRIHENAEY